jgi:hypothetical protein
VAALEHNVFRGQVLSFGQEVFGGGQTLLQFHRRPSLGADQLLRRAALLAATRTADDRELIVSAADLGAALDELLDTWNAMTRTLLGRTPG